MSTFEINDPIINCNINNNLFFFKIIPNFLKEKNCLSSLLPYDKSKKNKNYLQKSLNEYKMLLNVLQNAIKDFENCNYEKFDALVGENACQIRAIKIALIIKNNTIDEINLKLKIKHIKYKINELLNPENINHLINSDLSFQNLIDDYKIQLFLTHDEMFLVKSYLLTETKFTNVKDKEFSSLFVLSGTNHKQLQKYENITNTFLERLVKKTRGMMSLKSVDFIRNAIKKYDEFDLYSNYFNESLVKYRDLYCIPIYWSVKAVLKIMLEHSIPLVIHAKFLKNLDNIYKVFDEEYIYFFPKINKKGKYEFKIVSSNEINDFGFSIIFEGIVYNERYNSSNHKENWMSEFLSSSVVEIILSNAALHRQYPEKNLDQLLKNFEDDEYHMHKAFAEAKGFSINNPKFFLLRHIYTTKLQK
jgi:hypothetical protein